MDERNNPDNVIDDKNDLAKSPYPLSEKRKIIKKLIKKLMAYEKYS